MLSMMRMAILLSGGAAVAGCAAPGIPESRRLPGARAEVRAADHPSLQAAVDALPADGGLVVLPPGTFILKEPLRITKGDVLLRGAGTATRLANAGAAGAPAIVIGPAEYDKNPKAKIWRIALEDLRLEGAPGSGHGILARGVNEIYLHGITVSRHGGDGIRLENCYEDPRIADSLISYNAGAGLSIYGGHDIVVAANHFEENRDAVRCLDGFNLCLTGNNVDDHLGDGVVIENTYGSVVSGNMIEECQGAAVVLDRDCYGITLSANVIAHDGAGIDLRDAHGCAVTANTFVLVRERAVRIGPASGRIAVTGNTFADSAIGNSGEVKRPADDRAAGIVLEGTTDVAVSGNLFSGLSTKALTLEGAPSRRVLFSGNVLTDAESDHAKLAGAGGSVVDGNVEPVK